MPSPGFTSDLSTSRAPRAAQDSLLRIDLSSRIILEVAGPSLGLPGLQPGRPLSELWMPSERLALDRRLDDVILLGWDRIEAVSLAPGDGQHWVAIDATYPYREGAHLELRLRRLPRPSTDQVARETPASSSEPQAPRERRGELASDRAIQPGTSVFQALEAAGADALEVAGDGRVIRATPGVERLLGRPVDLIAGRPLDAVFRFSPEAGEALREARGRCESQSVLAEPSDGGAGLALDWLAGAEPGAGHAILTAPQRESSATERLRFQAKLVSSVAHDVRDSIAAVFCGLRTLAQSLPEEDPLQKTVAQAMEEAERANRITEDVLWVSRPGDLKRVELDVDMVVMEALSRYRKRASGARIELEAHLQSGCRVLADLSSIERVVGNLVENALDATPRGGVLRVETRPEDRAVPGVCIFVQDTGVGISDETKPHVFEPFVTDKHGGTGLGLAIARRVVLDHNGQIHFESELGQGTTFHVWLPLGEV